MAKRKIECKNTACKHNRLNGTCDTSIVIGGSGKCQSFEKGIVYYFQLVWSALGDKNYIDEIEMRTDPDLRIGLFYIIDCYNIDFIVMEWGSCRMYLLKDENDKSLGYEDIVARELDTEKFDKHFDDFEKGIMPGSGRKKEIKEKTDEEPVYEPKEFGWLSPTGVFTASPFGEHEESAERICKKYGWNEKYWKWENEQANANYSLTLMRDYLMIVKGYCLIHNPKGDGGYVVSYRMPLTEKQKSFLFKYFMDMGDRFKAEQFVE